MRSLPYMLPLVVAVLAFIARFALVAPKLRGLWMTSDRFNSTDDWIEVPESGQEPAPTGTPLCDWFRRAITPRLEPGETLEGFANGFFSPPRPRDWGIKMGLNRIPLLIAATPRRLLLFELGYRTVKRSCFIEYDAIRYLIPPKSGFMGTSGDLRFGLTSGREYRFGFLGPLFSPEGMREEQRLAAHLRALATRFPSSPTAHAIAA